MNFPLFGKQKYSVFIEGRLSYICDSYNEAKKYLNDKYGVDSNGNPMWENYDCGIVKYSPEHDEMR